METNIQLSIIIPFYNVEKYIGECLQSVYEQDIPESEYEVICVNDCSPDNSRQIVLAFQTQHTNLQLLEQLTNQKQGAARNRGIRQARGKYIWFIDSDDFIAENCIGNLLNILETNDLDIVNFNLSVFYNDETKTQEAISPTTEITTGAYWLRNLKKNFDENAYPVTKIFRTKFLIDNNLYFPENRYYEDQYFCLFAVYQAEKFKYIQQVVYFYVKRTGSTLNSRLSSLHYISAIECGADYLAFFEKIKTDDSEFAQKVMMSGLYKINFGCKEIPYYSAYYRKRMIASLHPYLDLLKNSHYFDKKTIRYFKHFKLANSILYIISPVLLCLRHFKRKIKKIL